MITHEKMTAPPVPGEAPADDLAARLAAPFSPGEVKFKPGVVSGNRALALAYVDARVIQDRLDSVLGVMGWQDDYEWLEGGSVLCRLRIRIGDEWITKVDVGGPSEQPDEGDQRKAAVSDALKRAAVKFGVGRYLYRLPGQWVDYDSHKRQFTRPPGLPAAARPAPTKQPAVPPRPAPTGPPLPADGAELEAWLHRFDKQLVEMGLCKPGELLDAMHDAGRVEGWPPEIIRWNPASFRAVVDSAKSWAAQRRAERQEQPA